MDITSGLNITRQLNIKCFYSEIIFFGLTCKEINSYGQKHFREMNDHLCKVSTA